VFVPNFTTKSAGMGLGLAMVQRIVESANGRIWFETESGVGTTFFVALPRVD
jgi:two-component system nitrogen regulation sensor histidine kinase NtrY